MNKKQLNIKHIASILALSALASACSNSGGSGNNGSNNNNGDVSVLQLVAPKTIYSLPSATGVGYVVINNPTGNAVKNLHYSLSNQQGSGTSAEIDSASAALCAVVAAYSQCNLKVTIPAGAVAGSIGVIADNSDRSLLSKLGKSLKADTVKGSAYSGIEQAAYNSLSGADGVTLSYYHTVINGTPYILVSGLVASANAGSFNNVVLVDGNNNPIPNQQLIAGSGSYTQGSTFSVLLPAPAGNNLSQTIKIQTQQVNNGQTTVVSTATTSSTLTTKEGVGIAEMLPSSVYLTSTSPEQTISFVNTGDALAQLQELTANNPNIEVVFNPTSLASGTIATAVLKLKNPQIAGTSGNVSLSYNNGQEQTVTSGIVDQNVNPAPSPSPTPTPTPTPTPIPPIAGLTAIFAGGNNSFYTTTAIGMVSRQLTLTNTGNTPENNIILTLPTNFSITAGSSNSCTVTQSTSPATISNTLAASGGSCNVTVTYNNPAVTSQGTGNISIDYNYNGTTQAPTPTIAAVSYQVTQSTASLSISPSNHNFGSIVDDNTDASSDVEFTITNSGDAPTDGTSFTRTITGTDSGMFSMNNTDIAPADVCGTSLAVGASCKVNVKFGPTATAVNPASATLNANYVPYSGQSSTTTTSSLSGVSVSAASINISAPVGNSFNSGDGSNGNPYKVVEGNTATLTYTFTNTGTQDATNFYVINSTLPSGWTRTGGSCAAVTGTNLPNTGSNSCTVEYTITAPSSVASDTPNDFNQNVMTTNWTDGANPSGISQAIASGVTYVTVQPPPPLITISSLTGTSSSVMGTTPITVTATISGSGSLELTATLANSITGTIVSDPSPCALDASGTTSCTFSIIPWYTGFDNSIVDTASYDPFTPTGTDITLSATNGASITGVTANTINYMITTPYVYLAAPAEGAASATNTGITWGAGGTVATRFTAGTQNSGAACASGEEIQVDNLTGLMWVRAPTSNTYTWANAKTAPAIPASFCGYSDWRLPTINELTSLVNYATTNPAGWLNNSTQDFTNVQSYYYWSSTAYDGSNAWAVDFDYGVNIYDDNTAAEFYVWPVRGGQ